MKSNHKLLTSFFLLLVLVGCSDAKDTLSTDTILDKTGANETSNPLSGQMDALQKAKNLEAEMQKSVEDRLNAIDSQK